MQVRLEVGWRLVGVSLEVGWRLEGAMLEAGPIIVIVSHGDFSHPVVTEVTVAVDDDHVVSLTVEHVVLLPAPV